MDEDESYPVPIVHLNEACVPTVTQSSSAQRRRRGRHRSARGSVQNTLDDVDGLTFSEQAEEDLVTRGRGKGAGRRGQRAWRRGRGHTLDRENYSSLENDQVNEGRSGQRGGGQGPGRGRGRLGSGRRGRRGGRGEVESDGEQSRATTQSLGGADGSIACAIKRGNRRRGGVGKELDADQNQLRRWQSSDSLRNTNSKTAQPSQIQSKEYIERPMGYKRLSSIASLKSSEEVAMELTSSRSGFSLLLNAENMRPDWLILTLHAVEKACHAVHKESIFRVLTLVCASRFIERHLMNFLTGALTPPYSAQIPDHLKKVLFLFEQIFQRLPSSSEKCVPCLVMMKQVIEAQQLSFCPEIDARQKELMSSFKKEAVMEREDLDASLLKYNRRVQNADEEAPPEDFRTVEVFPALEEFNNSVHVFLRQNKTEGAYASLDNYLDVHFRLLREDYMQPLRKGIREYKQCVKRGESPSKMTDLNMYYGVNIIGSVCTEDVETRLKFDTAKTQKINWQASKRLNYGSLVCLSPDNFETMLYATVVNRNAKDLSKGIIQVKVHECLEYLLKFSTSDTFVMAETTAYFEAYKHVLYRLQEIQETMPFQKYLVQCKTDVGPPKYILSSHGIVYYNLQALGSSDELNRVPVLNTLRWPPLSEFDLDVSQLAAVKTALSKELAVIQGPPGTGKTYVGLKIAEILLEHKSVWGGKVEDDTELDLDKLLGSSTERPGSVLIVCYTNHALDQFLEGIAKFEEGIVRIGGRSKSEEMKEFNLKELRQKKRRDREVRKSIFDNVRDCKREMSSLRVDIEQVTAKIEASSLGILHEKMLEHVIEDNLYASLVSRPRGKVSALQFWLGFGDLQTTISGVDKSKEKLISKWEEIVLRNIQYPTQKPPPRRIDENKVLEMNIVQRFHLYHGWISAFQCHLTDNLRQVAADYQPEEEYFCSDENMETQESYIHQLDSSKTHILMDVLLRPFVPENVFRAITTGKYARFQDGYAIKTWLGTSHSVFEEGILKAMEELGIEEVDIDYDEADEEEEMFGVSSDRFVDDKDDLFDTDSGTSKYLITQAMSDVALNFSTLQTVYTDEQTDDNTDICWEMQPHQLKQLKKNLQSLLKSKRCMDEEQVLSVQDIWQLNSDSRADLYRYWIKKYQSTLKASIMEKEQEYQRVANRQREVRLEEDKDILKEAVVIGMTTTGAAKHAELLKAVAPKIIIVEEAAEVLESHIITTLNASCQHLILIGDHQQLKPNPTVYDLAKLYNLDLSLFERLINNKIHHITLSLQHRMRPEVALLMKHIYPNLENHDSVTKYPHVKGVSKDVFFIHHEKQEAEQHETKSKSNEHEAAFIVALCRYFLQQGYRPEDVTILAPYTGQILLIKSHMRRTPEQFKGVRLTSVDNFQGEECKIILLSLVRSNIEGSVGFLGIENRICVALSRAKEGLFAIGNMKLLAQKCNLWKKIVETLGSSKSVGLTLGLQCQNHPEETINAQAANDFMKAPEGGCSKPCDTRLSCGHVCERICHIADMEHNEYKCGKPCRRNLPNCKHSCPQKCFEKCRPCNVKVPKLIPMCGHTNDVVCSKDPILWECKLRCEKVLPCGHKCTGQCGKCRKNDYHKECKESVEKIFPCGHTAEIPCKKSGEVIPCPQPCGSTLNCGHKCSGSCGECLGGKIHNACTNPCLKDLKCSHRCAKPCGAPCQPCQEICKTFCSHSSCRKRCCEPCEPCNEPCQVQCRHRQCSKTCSEECNVEPCNELCGRQLDCGHTCGGLCGEHCVCLECEKHNIVEQGKIGQPEIYIKLKACDHIFRKSYMDVWMAAASNRYAAIPCCPLCQKVVVESRRYAKDMQRLFQERQKMKATETSTRSTIITTVLMSQLPPGTASAFLKVLRDPSSSYSEQEAIKIQCSLFADLKKVTKPVVLSSLPDSPAVKDFRELETSLLQPKAFMSAQMTQDYRDEIRKLADLIQSKVRTVDKVKDGCLVT